MPSCVVVAQGTLNPPAQVRILARQPEKSMRIYPLEDINAEQAKIKKYH